VAGGGAQTEAEKQALAIYRDLQEGHIDRSLLAPNLNDYFSEQAVADFRDSLAPLGEPLTFKQIREELRGGMTLRVFRIVYPGKHLSLSTYTYPNGKLEQFLVDPAD
jgi:D-alanyl-D-alanine carboxypeptidase